MVRQHRHNSTRPLRFQPRGQKLHSRRCACQQCAQTVFFCSCLSGESSGLFCRICHEGEAKEDLISPCRCTGTMGLIHVACIEKWLSQAGTSKCEICGFEYTTEKTPRSLKEVRESFECSPGTRPQSDKCWTGPGNT